MKNITDYDIFMNAPLMPKELFDIMREYGDGEKTCYDKLFDILNNKYKNKDTISVILSGIRSGTRIFSKEIAIMCCFALGCDYDNANSILSEQFGYSLHTRYYVDLIYGYFLLNNSIENCVECYNNAYRMIEEFKPYYSALDECNEKIPEEYNDGGYTGIYSDNMFTFENEDQLREYLCEEETKKYSGECTRTVFYHFYKNMDIILHNMLIAISTEMNIDFYELCGDKYDNNRQTLRKSDMKENVRQQIKIINGFLNPHSEFVTKKAVFDDSYVKGKGDFNALPEYKKVLFSTYNQAAREFEEILSSGLLDDARTQLAVKLNSDEAKIALRKLFLKNFYNMCMLSNYDLLGESVILRENPYFHKMTGALNLDDFPDKLPKWTENEEIYLKYRNTVLKQVTASTNKCCVIIGKADSLVNLLALSSRFCLKNANVSSLSAGIDNTKEAIGIITEYFGSESLLNSGFSINDKTISRDLLIFTTFLRLLITASNYQKPVSKCFFEQEINRVLDDANFGRLNGKTKRMDRFVLSADKLEFDMITQQTLINAMCCDI